MLGLDAVRQLRCIEHEGLVLFASVMELAFFFIRCVDVKVDTRQQYRFR